MTEDEMESCGWPGRRRIARGQAAVQPRACRGRVRTLLKSYGVSQISGDRFANVWPVEVFDKVGVTYEQNAEPKSTLYTNMLPLLNSSASSCWTSRARSPSYAALSGAPRAAGATRSTILEGATTT
jgi:hypothetical protein